MLKRLFPFCGSPFKSQKLTKFCNMNLSHRVQQIISNTISSTTDEDAKDDEDEDAKDDDDTDRSNVALIRQYFINHCGECQEYQCVSYMRNHRDRSKPLTERYYNCDEDNYQLIALQQIFDSIHCAIFHSIMYQDDKISIEENQKRKIKIMRQRHSNMYTIDTGIDIKTDTEIEAELEQKVMQYELEEKDTDKIPIPHQSAQSMPEIREIKRNVTTISSTKLSICVYTIYTESKAEIIINKSARQPHNSIFEEQKIQILLYQTENIWIYHIRLVNICFMIMMMSSHYLNMAICRRSWY